MEKIIVGKWYRHYGNTTMPPARVSKWHEKYDVVIRRRSGAICVVNPVLVLRTRTWKWCEGYFADIMAYKFVEKK